VPDPRAELLARVEVRRARVVALERRDARLALARLVAVAVAGALAIASLGAHRLSARWLPRPRRGVRDCARSRPRRQRPAEAQALPAARAGHRRPGSP